MTHPNTIGIDISKAHLDAYRLTDGACARFDNTPAGHKVLLAWIEAGTDRGDRGEPPRIVFEATGRYHRAVEIALARAGLAAVKVNPRNAKSFARALGRLAKTDTLDAAMLARMGAALDLDPTPARSEILNQLKDLQVARAALIKDRTAATNRAQGLTQPLLRRQIAARLKQIKQQIAQIDAAINSLIKTDPALARRFAILLSIPGVGAVSAAMLLIEMPELGALNEKQVASLAGTAPRTQQSGTWSGKAYVHGGRRHVRSAIYMCALVAARHNPDLAAKYKQLLGAGKAPKQALAALMRKLVILANSLLRDDRTWQPKHA